MPVCKNDPHAYYSGTEPSPRGLGICAHAVRVGSKRKGRDGTMWVVKEDCNGTKSWKRVTAKSKLVGGGGDKLDIKIYTLKGGEEITDKRSEECVFNTIRRINTIPKPRDLPSTPIASNSSDLNQFNFLQSVTCIHNFMDSRLDVIWIPKGTVLFRGLTGIRDCKKNVHSPHTPKEMFQNKCSWYSTFDVASEYSENAVFAYITSRPLLLLELTSANNINQVAKHLKNKITEANNNKKLFSPDKTKKRLEKDLEYLQIATGVNMPVTDQLKKVKKYVPDAPDMVFGTNAYKTEDVKRCSIFEIDLAVSEMLRREYPFLDGYFGRQNMSPIIADWFHPEVCLFGSRGKVTLDMERFRLCKDTPKNQSGGQTITLQTLVEPPKTESITMQLMTQQFKMMYGSSQSHNDRTWEEHEKAELQYHVAYLC